LGWIVLACAFAAVWVYAFYREDRRNPEPIWLVCLAVLGGMAAAPFASRVEAFLSPDLNVVDGTLAARAGLAFLVAGPVEETAKFLAVALLIWFQSHFDEPMDGIVYAAAASAGFALAENLFYIQDEPMSIIARGPAATGAHILFGIFWGGALGHAKQVRGIPYRALILSAGLLLGYLSHGLFDLVTWSADRELTTNQARLVQITLIVGCALFTRWRIRVALRTAVVEAAV
jgi:RsiW-degrading membrane proteinase PrsW (M82 family)